MDHRSESSSLALSWLLEQEVIIFCPVAKIKRWYLIFLQTTDIFTFLCLYKTCRFTLALHVHDLTFTSGGGEGVVLELQSLHFNIYKCDTTGYFQGHLGSISGCIFNRKLGHVHRVCGQKKVCFSQDLRTSPDIYCCNKPVFFFSKLVFVFHKKLKIEPK